MACPGGPALGNSLRGARKTGDAVDRGEAITQTAACEARVESGIECTVTGLAGIYYDPDTSSSTPACNDGSRDAQADLALGRTPCPAVACPIERRTRVIHGHPQTTGHAS
jgi:hypothetical protein